jgi:N-acetylglucosaminyldiphosphoundecaprenol N-acetyl-beta-D-mannosaminyltransferase
LIEALDDVVQADVSTATIAGIRIDALPFDAVVNKIIQRASSPGKPDYVVTPNAHHMVMLQNDELFREIYREAFLVVPDGVSLLWAAKLLGVRLRGRVNGTDLFEALCQKAANKGLRIFLLGGREGAAEKAARILESRHPGLQICGFCCPPLGFENESSQAENVLAKVSASRPDLLFVGLGAPKQEYWIYRHLELLNVPVSIGVGVSFEFVAGIVARAPRWMQNAGLEWLHRVCVEPRRLWRRYLFSNAHFCRLIAGEFVAKQRAISRRVPSDTSQPEAAITAAAKEPVRFGSALAGGAVESVE